MVRQAHTYLVSAVSGATLVAAAIAVFVVLVSVQVFEAWPITGIGGGNDGTSVSSGQATEPGAASAAAGTTRGAVAGAGSTASPAAGNATRPGGDTISTGAPGNRVSQPGGGAPGSEPGSGTGAGQDGTAGSPASPGTNPGATGSGGEGAGGSGGGGSTDGGSGSSTSGTVTNTVNETVNQVDQTVTGGALEKTGVTGVTEDVVDGTLGPESTVGKVVDGTVDVVGGLLNPKR